MIKLEAMWEPGWAKFFKNKDPQAIADEIYSIGDEPTKEEIVEKARDESTELHDLFEWRDDVAAEQWREEQAKNIMRKLKVTIIREEGEKPDEKKTFTPTIVSPRMFYGDPENPSGFVSIRKIMTNQDTYNALLQRAKDEIMAFERKYSILTELEPLFEAIHEIL